MTEFVEGWNIMQTLGEGTYGEVKLLTNRVTGSVVAMKLVDLARHENASTAVAKEATIHKMLNHQNVIGFYGQRQHQNYVCMFLEYASGGELFDRIEPDVGMALPEAQKYFSQLITGVEYLHSKGIAHRDIKPENILLDEYGNLKISDFGMATFFKVQGKERLLESRCGTLPYLAPEILETSYRAEPADIWSCGIVLVALLTGELPWDKPSKDCKEYASWKTAKYMQITPWSKLDTIALSLIRKILVPNPGSRYTIANIKSHRWFSKHFTRITDTTDSRNRVGDPSNVKISHSQPEKQLSYETGRGTDPISFSQPTQIENLLLSTQFLASQSNTTNSNCIQNLVRRMTRFLVSTGVDGSIERLSMVIDKLGYTLKSCANGIITICTMDRRRTPLTFKANVLTMENNTLMDFRLSKGCGLEFKRCFVAIKSEFQDLIVKSTFVIS